MLLTLPRWHCGLSDLQWLAVYAGIDASRAGVALVHLLITLPHVLIALKPAYRGFDPRMHAWLLDWVWVRWPSCCA